MCIVHKPMYITSKKIAFQLEPKKSCSFWKEEKSSMTRLGDAYLLKSGELFKSVQNNAFNKNKLCNINNYAQNYEVIMMWENWHTY